MKKILLVNGSPRNDGSSKKILNAISEKVSHEFESETVDLGKLKISHCKGCLSCKATGKCSIRDDMTDLYTKIRNADALAFAAPIYFGAENGLFKNFFDRLYATLEGRGGVYKTNFGKPKKAIMVLDCGAPDGDVKYQNVSVRLAANINLLGVADVISKIIPNTHAGVADSKALKDLLDEIEKHFG